MARRNEKIKLASIVGELTRASPEIVAAWSEIAAPA